ncbi:hypothetical protein evm_009193 [Chilo suppressalis]|nr:hypothetical protein evm_009193 [Chilo suppressalis]
MNKICRICLEEGVMSSIFAKNFNLSLCDMIEYCSPIKIRKDDGLPEQMCSNCVYKLGIAYHFKQTCESADLRLRQYLGLRMPEKCSDAAVMTEPVPIHTTVIKKCRCKIPEQRKSSSNYKKKTESEKQKRGPKPKPKQEHNCYQCDKQFRCQAQLEMHVSKRFSAQGNLQAHLKIHTGQRDHACSLCSKSFITSSELTRHMNKHRGVKNFKCDLCGAAYIHLRDFKLHKMKKHQICAQVTKNQHDNYNNSTNIDIIGIDVGSDIPQIPINSTKDLNHHNIQHLINDKQPQNILSHQNVASYGGTKELKDIC